MPILTQTTKAMKKQSFLALDMLQKEEIATLKEASPAQTRFVAASVSDL